MMKSKKDNSFGNEKYITPNSICGCFYCRKIILGKEIREWTEDKPHRTAICICGIDSLLVYDEDTHGTMEEFIEYIKFLQKEMF